MRRTGVVRDERYLEHVPLGYHPETEKRLEVLYSLLEEPDMRGRFVPISPRPATKQEIGLIHTPRYVDMVASTSGQECTMLDPDTYACGKSYETALLAAGGILAAVDSVMAGNVENAFALIRPPGHHAEASRAMGFCLFNNVAIGAAYALKRHRLQRTIIIDWDLHHGNGTQHSFYSERNVLYFSTHQYPYYPGTGHFNETGEGAGQGFTVNVPLPTGPGDAEYARIFEEVLEPVALQYGPQMIFVSAGFDIYYDDPLGGMKVTPPGFANLARIVLEFAEKTCGGRVVFVLEGGYHLDGLRDSVKEVLRTLSGEVLAGGRNEKMRGEIDHRLIDPVIRKVKETQKSFWKL